MGKIIIPHAKIFNQAPENLNQSLYTHCKNVWLKVNLTHSDQMGTGQKPLQIFDSIWFIWNRKWLIFDLN